jgi:hypothetical protein
LALKADLSGERCPVHWLNIGSTVENMGFTGGKLENLSRKIETSSDQMINGLMEEILLEKSTRLLPNQINMWFVLCKIFTQSREGFR